MLQVTTLDLGWAAGFLEGEGTFYGSRTTYVTAGQVDVEPLERLRRLFGGKIHLHVRAGKGLSKQDLFIWRLYGENAVGVMMTLYSVLSARKRQRVVEALRLWRGRGLCRNRDYWRRRAGR